jgi:hypothetical protein
MSSSFQLHHRCIPDTELSTKHGKSEQDSDYDLISFLAVVQTMKINILPITWQDARDLVGEGGTSKVTQAKISLDTSFAFKCLSDNQRQDLQEGRLSETNTFRTLINEIVVVGHSRLQRHPNIVDLQGICWDVTADDEVWPAFVFEKSQFGDLYHFLQLPIGRNISSLGRLKLCVDVGTAVIDMHSLGREI